MKTSKEIAEVLQVLYNTPSSGKIKGRFKLEMTDLRIIAGGSIPKPMYALINDELAHLGFHLVKGLDYVGVIEADKVNGWRSIPHKAIRNLFDR